MKLSELLQPECCMFGVEVSSRNELIERMAGTLSDSGAVQDLPAFIQAVYDREAEFSTAIGDGLAIPHGKTAAVAHPGLAFASIPNGVDYQSFDGIPVTIAFMVAVPLDGNDLHLRILGAIARKMVYEETKQALRNAKTYEEILSVFDDIDIQ